MKKKNETINLYTYEEWSALEEDKEIARLERAAYFMKQRIFACAMSLLSVVMVILDHKCDSPGLSGFGALLFLLAIYVFFTKQMMLTNEYFLRCNEEER